MVYSRDTPFWSETLDIHYEFVLEQCQFSIKSVWNKDKQVMWYYTFTAVTWKLHQDVWQLGKGLRGFSPPQTFAWFSASFRFCQSLRTAKSGIFFSPCFAWVGHQLTMERLSMRSLWGGWGIAQLDILSSQTDLGRFVCELYSLVEHLSCITS